MSECPNCKQDGPHFVGPSFGEEGFYVCETQHERVKAPVAPDMTNHAQQLYLSASKVVTDWFNNDDPQGQPPSTEHHIDLVKRIHAALTHTAQHLSTVTAALHTREEELEGYAWTISPAMAQAKIDELNSKLAARTYTWTTARPTVAGHYWFREGPNDNDPWILRVTEPDTHVIAGGQWAGPIMGPEERA
jgi:hypothetical protein